MVTIQGSRGRLVGKVTRIGRERKDRGLKRAKAYGGAMRRGPMRDRN